MTIFYACRAARAGVLLFLVGAAHGASLSYPQSFEANYGQSDVKVRFLSRGPGYSVFLTGDAAVFSSGGETLTMRTEGANAAVRTEGVNPLEGRSNYFLGANRSEWHRGVPTYARVRYRGVYPGIDLVYYISSGKLEYDFVLAPGADPGKVRLRFGGARTMRIDSRGDLVFTTAQGELRQHRPRVYQDIAGARREISGAYSIGRDGAVGFEIARYDRSQALVIDPVLSFSTYLGGRGLDVVRAIATDAAGNIYVAGSTESVNFPTTDGAVARRQPASQLPGHAFVAKLNPSGSALIYATYLGGVFTDEANAIAVDAQGNAYVGGTTRSPNFPTTDGAYQRFYNSGFTTIEGDGFVSKLDPSGSSLVYSSYFGGNAGDRVLGIAVDREGSAYLTGDTLSSNLPTTQGALRRRNCSDGVTRDAFISKLSPTGQSLAYSTYLCGMQADSGYGIVVDAQGAAYVVGQTVSTDFPTTPGALQTAGGGDTEDVFITKINPAGSALVFSTYLGGSLSDLGRGIALDAQNNVYVTGYTISTDFPTRAGSYRTAHSDGGTSDDIFVAKLNATGTQLVYSTYAGGSKTDRGQAIVVDLAGAAYVTGSTASPDFPLAAAKCQPGFGGSDDVFVMKLNPAGSALAYTMVMGGAGDDRGYGIALDASRNPIVAGQTVSVNYPTTSGVLASGNARGYGGGSDGFVARVTDGAAPTEPCISVNGVVNGASFQAGPVAPGEIVTILGAGIGPATLNALKLDTPDTLSRNLSDTRVLVDGVAVPLLYVRNDQLSAIMPYDVAGKQSVKIEVEYKGVKTAVFEAPVDASAPAIFTAGNGTGQGAVLNQNGSYNAFNNPASRGEVIVVYAMGGGETDPPSSDGKLLPDARKLKLPVRAQIGGQNAQVLYAGSAPGLIAGIIQVNLLVPDNAPQANAIPVVITIGNVSSQSGVTVAIQ